MSRLRAGDLELCEETKAEVENDPWIWESTGMAREQQTICCQTIPAAKYYQDERKSPWKSKKRVIAEIEIFQVIFIWCCKQWGVARLRIIKACLASIFIKFSFALLVEMI